MNEPTTEQQIAVFRPNVETTMVRCVIDGREALVPLSVIASLVQQEALKDLTQQLRMKGIVR